MTFKPKTSLIITCGIALIGATIIILSQFMLDVRLSSPANNDFPVANSSREPSHTPKRINISSRIDNIIKNMQWGNIAFNAPERMKLESSSTIQLVLSPTKSIDELKKDVVAQGEKEGARIRISDLMEARLSGSGFNISPITPETQAISWNEITEWKWDVVPNRAGRHNLYLTLTAIIDVEGSTMPRRIRTFDKTIDVEVSSWQTAFKFFQDNWEWAWTLIVFPVGYWIWRKHNRQTNENAGNSVTQQSENSAIVTEKENQSESDSETQNVNLDENTVADKLSNSSTKKQPS